MLRRFLRKNILIVSLLVAFVVIESFYLAIQTEIGWDDAVYIGMGKYIFSNGNAGLWEPIRPLTLPIILGFLWKIGLNPLIAGKIVVIVFSLAVILLTYILAKKIFDEKTAAAASILITFSGLMIQNGHQILVEVLTVLFLLLGFYFYLEKRHFACGMFFGFAFLTKFPAALFLIALFSFEAFYMFFKKEETHYFKKLPYILLGFAIVTLPYFLFNYIAYSDALFPIKSANDIIGKVVGCNVLHKQPPHYYFLLMLQDNFLNLFFVAGAFFAFRSKEKKYQMQILFYLALFFAYFMGLSCKTERYPILALPFIAMISGYGMMQIFREADKRKMKIILAIILLISALFSVNYIMLTINRQLPNPEFYSYIYNKEANGSILTTNPIVTLYTDKELGLIYYPLYNSTRNEDYSIYIAKNKKNISYIFVNTEDIPCHPNDLGCPERTTQLIKLLKSNFKIAYYKKTNNSEYFIFSQ